MTLRASDVIRLHMGHFIAPGHLPFAGATVVVNAFLIRHPTGPVLLDTGLGVGFAEVDAMYKPVRVPFDEVLKGAGVSVGDIRATTRFPDRSPSSTVLGSSYSRVRPTSCPACGSCRRPATCRVISRSSSTRGRAGS